MHEIFTFQQGEFESLSEAWERFSGLLRVFPYHGVSNRHTMLLFFDNLLPFVQWWDNISSRESFYELSAEMERNVIENMVSVEPNGKFREGGGGGGGCGGLRESHNYSRTKCAFFA
ncbi:hypothetical protein RND81_13G091700 [Saponaria officinalis]|uniref:Uncharacterized protein n=1 Tax=Saponaria officinalis TaxID=3572 RepID=A0AAW1GZ97_SAPOF